MSNYQPYIVFLFAVIVAASYFVGFTPPIVGLVFLLMSVIAYYYYGKDKKAAVNGEWRVQESTLHLLSLCCGWPGALLAQYKFRHKTKKVGFRFAFWFTVLANVSCFSWLHFPKGNLQLRNVTFKIENFTLTQAKSDTVISSVFFLTAFRERWPHVR